jgi:C-terminal processing protease CtpA/Prc
MLCHPETMRVQLKSDDIGFGLSLHGGVSGKRYRPIKIAVIEDGGPAALAGVLQVGDRIVSLNGVNVDGVATAHQALKLVQEGGDVLDMEVIFDVTDAVVPTSGTFDVKMVKTSSLNLGITINGSDKREDNIWISSLKKGGIACRMGTLKPGDVILAINGQSMEDCNLREAAHALRNAGDVVTLTISKECSEKPTTGLTASEAVIFSVELHSDGLPLGISLTGSNHQPQPVFIARIAEGGVAHRTGALKVGDRIMAINGQSLFGKTLRDAVFMLQNAGDTVTLKISKLNRRSQYISVFVSNLLVNLCKLVIQCVCFSVQNTLDLKLGVQQASSIARGTVEVMYHRRDATPTTPVSRDTLAVPGTWRFPVDSSEEVSTGDSLPRQPSLPPYRAPGPPRYLNDFPTCHAP